MLVPFDRVSHEDIVWLNRLIFRGYEFPSKKTFANIRKIDPRVPEDVGWYVTTSGDPVSQTGYLVYSIRCRSDMQRAGVVYAVGTLPSHRGLGHAKTVMDKVHSKLVEHGCNYSILSTSRIWKAHSWYQKLGYIELAGLDTIYGKLDRKSDNPVEFSLREYKPEYEAQMAKIFDIRHQNRYGFIFQPPDFITIRSLWADKAVNFKILENDGMPVGFVNIKSGDPCTISDFVLLPTENFIAWLHYLAGDSNLELNLSPHQYNDFQKVPGLKRTAGNGVMMIKDLTEKLSEAEIKQDLGINENKFVVSSIDRW